MNDTITITLTKAEAGLLINAMEVKAYEAVSRMSRFQREQDDPHKRTPEWKLSEKIRAAHYPVPDPVKYRPEGDKS